MRFRAYLRSAFHTAAVFAWWMVIRALARLLPKRAVSNRSLLIVSWHFPPFVGTVVQMVTSIARIAAEEGWRVTVVTAPRPEAPTPEGAEIERLNDDLMKVLRAPGRVDPPWSLYFMSPSARILPLVDGGFAAVVAMCWRALTSLWQSPPGVVLASGPVFANMVAAAHLARMLRSSLVLHYRDEWTVATPSFVAVDARSRELEEECLRAATLLWFVHVPQPALYTQQFPWLIKRPHIVAPNGWDKLVFDGAGLHTNHLEGLEGRFVLAFVGRATDSSPLAPMLTDLGNLRPDAKADFTLAVVGDQTPECSADLAQLADSGQVDVWRMSRVQQTVAVEIMREASAVLLLANTRYEGLLPLKIFDYMASGAPILVYGPTGRCASIVTDANAGLHVLPGDLAGLAAALGVLRARPREFWQTSARDEWVELTERRRIVRGVLQSISAQLPPDFCSNPRAG